MAERESSDRSGVGLLSPAAAPAASDASAPAVEAAPVPEPTWPEVDRRRTPDRRQRPTPFISSLFGPRRRRRGRRKGEEQDIYVDVFETRDVLLATGIFVLNVLDALFTLLFLQDGGQEGNPLMRHLINMGAESFLFEKLFVVGVWLLVLMSHKNFKAARFGLKTLLGLYGLILILHFASRWILAG